MSEIANQAAAVQASLPVVWLESELNDASAAALIVNLLRCGSPVQILVTGEFDPSEITEAPPKQAAAARGKLGRVRDLLKLLERDKDEEFSLVAGKHGSKHFVVTVEDTRK